MNPKAALTNLANLDSAVVKNIKDIRLARLTIARRQLEDLEKTAHAIRNLPNIKFAADEFSIPELKKVLVEKINLLEQRSKDTVNVFHDEMNLAMEIMDKRSMN